MQVAEARPPYVTFEVQAEEDRAATLAAGHYVAKDVTYAIVTPQGSKDRIPRQVDDWFANLAEQVKQGRFSEEWLQAFTRRYAAWKEGRQVPLEGTPVMNWPAVSPAQLSALQTAHILTVEDLASANEEAISRLGMGGRALKQRAIEWLEAANGNGKAAEQIAALKQENEDLRATNNQLLSRLEELAAAVKQLQPPTAPPAAEVRRL